MIINPDNIKLYGGAESFVKDVNERGARIPNIPSNFRHWIWQTDNSELKLEKINETTFKVI